MKNLLFLFAAVTLLASCNKELSESFTAYPASAYTNDTTWHTGSPYFALNSFLDTAKTDGARVDSLDVSAGGKVSYNNAELSFGAGFCNDSSGQAIFGKVKVSTVLVQKHGDLIRLGLGSVTIDKVLEPEVFLKVSITRNGKAVLVNSGAIKLRIKKDTTLPQAFVVDITKSPFTLTAADTIKPRTFQDKDPNTGAAISGYEVNNTFSSYTAFAYYAATAVSTDRIDVTLPVNYTNANSAAFIVFKNKNTVIRMTADFSARSFYAGNIPIGTSMTIVTVSKYGDKLYLGSKDVTMAAKTVVRITPAESSAAGILSFLATL